MWGADPWTRPRIVDGVRKLFWCLKLLRVKSVRLKLGFGGVVRIRLKRYELGFSAAEVA